MSDWWAKKLGTPPPPQQQTGTPPVPQAVPPQQRPMPQVPQQYAPAGQVQQVQHQGTGDEILPDGTPADVLVAHNAQRLATKEYNEVPQEAKNLIRHGGTCPDCGSGNYFRTERHQHCHDCGYPIIQSGSGLGALATIQGTGPARPAASPAYTQQIGG